MSYDDEALGRYVDGAAAAGERAAIERAAAADPALARRSERMRRIGGDLRAVYDPALSEAPPAGLEAMIRAALPARAPRPAAPSRRWAWLNRPFAAGLGLAAGGALGLAVGLMPVQDIDVDRSGALVARGDLGRALERQLASEQGGVGAVTIGVSFRSADGRFCRSFTRGALAGLACRDGEDWRIETAATAAPGSDGPYAQASAAMPPAVRTAIGGMIAGEALDADAERAARDRGWRGE